MTTQPLLVAAARGERVPRMPVWLMRQAGRYLPEYRKIREKHSFLEMARIPELAVEITLQPLRRFALDGAIVFSDILVVPEALGFPYEIVEATGPVFARSFQGADSLREMQARIGEVTNNLDYFYQALKILSREVPATAQTAGRDATPALLGFAGAPFTLAVYLVEGQSKTDLDKVRLMARLEPALFEGLLALLEEAVGAHLVAQARAGAQMVQIFESFANVLPVHLYEKYCAAPARRIVDRVRRETGVVVSYFSKGSGGLLNSMKTIEADVYSVDWVTDLKLARSVLGSQVCLQGNLDPTVLHASPEAVERETRAVLRDVEPGSRHIFNLGHGVLPKTPIASIEALLRTVHAASSTLPR